MSSSCMAIHCLLEETLLLRYLLGLLLQGALALSACGTSVIDMLPNWPAGSGPTRSTVIHAFQQETLVVTTPATSSLSIWAASIHSTLVVARTAMETRPSLLCTCVTHRRDHRDHKTISAVMQHGRTAEGPPQEPGAAQRSLLVLYPLALLSCNRPRSARRSAASHEESSPASTSAIYQYYMHICMGFPAQDASLICSLRTASRHFQCCRIVAAAAASLRHLCPIMPQIPCHGTRSLYCE